MDAQATSDASDSSDTESDTEPICCYAPSKYVTRKKTINQLVWNMYIGEHISKSKCYCCKLSNITRLSFYCGHIISEKNGGSFDVNNSRPVCQKCKSSMGTTNMDEFMRKYIENV